jgi:hypothetical protein
MDNVISADATSAATEPRSLAANRGLGWWTEAWLLFLRNPLLWVALGVILLVGVGVISLVPVLGGVAISLLMPVLVGGWMLAARKVEQGGVLDVADLFAGFQGERFTPLLVLGALLLAAMVVIGLVGGLLGLGAMWGVASGGMRHSAGGMLTAMGAGLLAALVVLLLFAIATTALWFAPALVVFRKTPPVEALRLSVRAVLKNLMPFLVYGAIYIAASFVATIPFALGWIVLVPVSLLTVYGSYREVFDS